MSILVPPFAQPFANTLITASGNHFSGRLAVNSDELAWNIFFRLGRIVWIEGGVHPLRRWVRLCERYLPRLEVGVITASPHTTSRSMTWAYQTLCVALQQHLTSREQLQAAIMDGAMEAMFDILQVAQQANLTYLWHEEEAPPQSLALLNVKDVFTHALQQWETWQHIELGDYSPNLAPYVVSVERLRTLVSPQAAHRLVNMARGDRSLRDLAVTLNSDLLRLSRSLLGGVRQGAIALIEIEDYELSALTCQPVYDLPLSDLSGMTPAGLVSSPPVSPISSMLPLEHPPRSRTPQTLPHAAPPARSLQIPSSGKNRSHVPSTTMPEKLHEVEAANAAKAAKMLAKMPKLSIVHIDDSPQNCGIARTILESAGYDYFDINDPLQAIPALLQVKPALILLDLMMPIVNGYELCSQIRRVSSLKDLPIVMLTSQDGIVDRVRAKVVKASAFLPKPIEPTKLLQTVAQFAPIQHGKDVC